MSHNNQLSAFQTTGIWVIVQLCSSQVQCKLYLWCTLRLAFMYFLSWGCTPVGFCAASTDASSSSTLIGLYSCQSISVFHHVICTFLGGGTIWFRTPKMHLGLEIVAHESFFSPLNIHMFVRCVGVNLVRYRHRWSRLKLPLWIMSPVWCCTTVSLCLSGFESGRGQLLTQSFFLTRSAICLNVYIELLLVGSCSRLNLDGQTNRLFCFQSVLSASTKTS